MTLSNDLLDRLVITTNSGSFLEWLDRRARDNSPWVFPFGLSCCALEHAATFNANNSISHSSFSPTRVSPEDADLMIFGGSVSHKLLPVLQDMHRRLKKPKWVMGIGACAASGGLYADGYSIVPGLNLEFPVDVYVPGCPPGPDQLMQGFEILRDRMKNNLSRWHAEQESIV